MKPALVAAITLFAILPTVMFSDAFAASCIELANCSLHPGDNPLEFLLQPLTMTFGDGVLLAVWGMVIGYIWIRTGNSMYAGFIGVLIAASFVSGTTMMQSLKEYFYMAIILLIASLGLTLYSVWRRGESGF